MKSGRCRRIL